MSNTKIKSWYTAEFQSDELGREINPKLSFDELHNEMQNGKDIYDCLKVYDSIIRERVMRKLAKIFYHGNYNKVYNLWLSNI